MIEDPTILDTKLRKMGEMAGKKQNRISLKTVLKTVMMIVEKAHRQNTYINVKAIYYIRCSQYIFVCQYIKPSYFYLLPQISTAGR